MNQQAPPSAPGPAAPPPPMSGGNGPQWAGQNAPTSRHPTPPARQPGGTMVNLPVEPSGDPDRITPLGWVVRGLVLLGVSVTSGLLWLALTPGADDEAGPENQGPKTKHHFQLAGSRDGFQDCADVSTDAIKEFFEQHGCEHLARALYTTTLPNGERVLTSVVSVRMSSPSLAQQLDKLVTTDGTGNVQDLVSDGENVPDSFPPLDEDFGYDSVRQQDLVVVGESAYFSNPDREDATLTSVTTDALKLGKRQDTNQPG